MSQALTLQLDDDLFRLLATVARSEQQSVTSFIETAIRARIGQQMPSLQKLQTSTSEEPLRRQSDRRRKLERLFELFDGHDAEAEIRRLKEQDEGF